MATVAQTGAGAATWERFAPLTGVGAVVLWIVGLITMGDVAGKSKGSELLAYYRDNDNRILVGFVIFAIGVAFFIWFLGSLRRRLFLAEGGDGRLTAIAYGSGIATAIALMLMNAPHAGAALSSDDLDASASRALASMGDAGFLAAEFLLPVVLFATALVALRHAALPKWLAWLSLIIGIVLLIGPIGWAALIFAFPIWILITSWVLWKPAVAGQQ